MKDTAEHREVVGFRVTNLLSTVVLLAIPFAIFEFYIASVAPVLFESYSEFGAELPYSSRLALKMMDTVPRLPRLIIEGVMVLMGAGIVGVVPLSRRGTVHLRYIVFTVITAILLGVVVLLHAPLFAGFE